MTIHDRAGHEMRVSSSREAFTQPRSFGRGARWLQKAAEVGAPASAATAAFEGRCGGDGTGGGRALHRSPRPPPT